MKDREENKEFKNKNNTAIHSFAILSALIASMFEKEKDNIVEFIDKKWDSVVEEGKNSKEKKQIISKKNRFMKTFKSRLKSFLGTSNLVYNAVYTSISETPLKRTIEAKMIDKLLRIIPKLYEESVKEAEGELIKLKKQKDVEDAAKRDKEKDTKKSKDKKP